MTAQPGPEALCYDGRADTWRAAYASAEPFGQRLQRRRKAVVDAVEQRLQGRRVRILDAGCGTGEVANALRAAGHEVVAMDVSDDMLREARRSRSADPAGAIRGGYVRGSVRTLPIRSRSLDVVLCVGVMGHLMRRRVGEEVVEDTAILALRELVRVLRPGGFLVVTAPNLFRVHWLLGPQRLRRALRHRDEVRAFEEGHGSNGPNEKERRLVTREGTRRWTPREWRHFLANEGLRIVDCRGVGFGPFTVLDRKIMSSDRAVRLSAALERSARSLPPLNWLGAHLVTTLTPR